MTATEKAEIDAFRVEEAAIFKSRAERGLVRRLRASDIVIGTIVRGGTHSDWYRMITDVSSGYVDYSQWLPRSVTEMSLPPGDALQHWCAVSTLRSWTKDVMRVGYGKKGNEHGSGKQAA